MAMKPKDLTGAGPAAIVDAVAASAQQIWQAGLGAFAKAQHDGGALFDTLVREGAPWHALTQEFGGDKVSGVAGKVGRLASGSWEKIEKIFEDRVARSLRSLGVPSREEVDTLRREIDALKMAMQGLSPAQAATARKPAANAAGAKAAAKRAPPQSSSAPKRPARADGARVRG